jgi:hypothetical protein
VSRPSFREQVNDTLANRVRYGPLLDLGRTSAIYRMLGFPDLPLRMTRPVLLKIASGKQGHRPAIAPEHIARFPEFLDEAFMVFESFTEIGCLLAAIDARDAAGKLVVVALARDCIDANSRVNLCQTACGKERADWFDQQINAGRLLYLDKEKGQGIPEVSNLPLLQQTEPGSHDPQLTRILGADDLRNYRTKCAMNLQVRQS